MTEVKDHPAGNFCWVELGTGDSAAAERFYGRLFGWQSREGQVGTGAPYTLLSLGSRDVAGLYELSQAQVTRGIQPHWLSYVRVVEADRAGELVRVFGGSLLSGPTEIPEMGRMAVVADPAGAIFALWQAGRHRGSGLLGVPGAPCWNELLTPDPLAVEPFYKGVFGWEAEVGLGLGDYKIFRNGEQSAAGLASLSGEGVPPYWLSYFAVEDCDASVAVVRDQEGSVLVEPEEIPTVGRLAVVADPQGAVFAIIRLAPPNA
jgi:predicted enzyme related to lactoylglutathione lyase